MTRQGTPETGAETLESWWEQHSRLDQLVLGLEGAFSNGSIGAASEALDALTDALEEHFGLEEQVYFPLVERLSREHAPAIQAAKLGHQRVRERLEQVRELIGEGQLVPARRALHLLLERFRTHEADETRLIEALEEIP